jgi:hypothetical protein
MICSLCGEFQATQLCKICEDGFCDICAEAHVQIFENQMISLDKEDAQ